MIFQSFREIVLGEHVVGQNPDCNRYGCLAKTFTRSVQKYKLHENYNSSIIGGPYDLALIRLNQSVPMFNDQNPQESGVKPVCLPWFANDPGRVLTTEADLLVTGWGRVTNNRRVNNQNLRLFKASTRTLKKLKVPAVSRKSCDKIEIFKNLNTDLQICAGGVEGKFSQCLIITEKSLIQHCERSYVYILSEKKLIKTANNGPFW